MVLLSTWNAYQLPSVPIYGYRDPSFAGPSFDDLLLGQERIVAPRVTSTMGSSADEAEGRMMTAINRSNRAAKTERLFFMVVDSSRSDYLTLYLVLF